MKKLFLLLLLLALPSLASAQQQYVVKAYNLGDTSFTYCTQAVSAATPTCGAAVTDGWMRTPTRNPITFVLEWITKAATSLEWQIECKATGDGLPVVVNSSASLTAAGNTFGVIWAHNWHSCRVGLKLTTDSGTNSVTSYMTQN